jgi:hypothetical protein
MSGETCHSARTRSYAMIINQREQKVSSERYTTLPH